MAQGTQGKFITFEGGEGAGKSTQVSHLATALNARGIDVVTTREPGGTPGAEAIRDLLMSGVEDRWDAWTEALLMIAARRDHIVRKIQPALASGSWVLCDRFADSTLAYQGAAGGLGVEPLRRLMAPILSDCVPDLTVVIDVPVEVGLERAVSRGEGADRFEARNADFHQAVRDGFLTLAAEDTSRYVVLDGIQAPGDVATQIAQCVAERLL